ncbi:ankyrin repeat-containing protein [Niveomyces insectorum RCEF 264]|uniref:Ankyrin repeat-containing protein n=1 Tax=Niveomyces insectorum RCEF 264 TaxID=1081102 RepID=A0A167MHJ5_9HYPO|nr:ankyrin repeat-containing protein [Niveomyces insectorum RCEF 264]
MGQPSAIEVKEQFSSPSNVSGYDADFEKNDKPGSTVLKTTKDGIPLHPQPSDDPDDPLNWSFAQKHAALFVLAMESLVIKFSNTLVAPGAHTLAAQFGTAASTASYIGSAPSVLYAFAPFLWIPLSHRVGRRPVLLASHLVALLAAIGVGRAQSYSQALGCRMLMGFGGSAGLCISTAGISDMFFLHEKGTRLGLNGMLFVVAPYVGGLAGGAIQQNKQLGWRWAMYIAAIVYAVQLIAQFLLVPETIYDKDAAAAEPAEAKKTLYRRLGFRTPAPPPEDTWLKTFQMPFTMFAYPAVVLPSFWAAVCIMTEVGNTAGLSLNFGSGTRFNFTVAQVGYCFIAGLIGSALGEVCAGPLCDLVAKRSLRKNEEWVPEKVLKLFISGLATTSTGLLIYGFTLEYVKPSQWAAPLTGLGLFVFGQEIVVTVLLTYMAECYPGRTVECTIVFQFFLNLLCFPPPFFTPQWIKQSPGAKVPYIVYAVLPIVFFPLCVGMFMWRGEAIRRRGAVLFFWKRKC